jgi:hypothetical protein
MDTVTWTDDKIEALDGKVDALDTRVGTLEKKVDAGFARAEVEYVRTDERFKAVNRQLADLAAGQALLVDKFDTLNRTLLQVGGGLIGTLVAGIVTLIGLMLTH